MTPLALHPGLSSQSRWWPGERAGFRAWEIVALLLCGVTAVAVAQYVKWPVRQMPGHAIVNAMLPLALGLALVPRYGAGGIMSASAGVTVLLLKFVGHSHLGMGAITSACLTGLVLDATLWVARRGAWVYLGFILAGLLTNLAAMFMRGMPKYIGWDALDDRPWTAWLAQATFTYPFFGLLAGLICATIFFSTRAQRTQPSES